MNRDCTAPAPNVKWCGDLTEIPTEEGKLYFASVLDLHSRRLLASATSDHPDAALACDAMKMAAAVRGGRAVIDGVVFHTDRGSTYTATTFTTLCRRLGVAQSMGRVGSCFDNAAAETFFSTLEHEVLSWHHFITKAQARQVVVAWCQDFYNTRRPDPFEYAERGPPRRFITWVQHESWLGRILMSCRTPIPFDPLRHFGIEAQHGEGFGPHRAVVGEVESAAFEA